MDLVLKLLQGTLVGTTLIKCGGLPPQSGLFTGENVLALGCCAALICFLQNTLGDEDAMIFSSPFS